MNELFLELWKDTLLAPVTVFLLIVTLTGSIIGLYKPVFRQYCTLHPYSVYRGKSLHTVLTAGFVHRSWGHLLFNTLLIFYIPGLVEELFVESSGKLGHFQAFVMYVLTIIGGNMGSVFWHRNKFVYTSIGASTVLFGSMAALLLVMKNAPPLGNIPFIQGFGNLHLYFILLMIASALLLIRKNGQFDHAAHFFSIIFGSVLIWLMGYL